MIKIYETINDKVNETDYSDGMEIKPGTWVHLISPSAADAQMISEKTGLDAEMLKSALDPEESAHIDFDDDNLIVLDIPLREGELYETVPFAIMYNKDYYVSMCSQETSLPENVIQKTKKLDTRKKNRLSLQIMMRITAYYIAALKQIDNKCIDLENRIRTSTKNKEIFELMNLNKSLIYFSVSLNANKNAFLKLEKIKEFRAYEEDDDLLDDVIIENNQAIEMCTIHRGLLDGMMSAFASVTSNNLNIIMKMLAIVTLVISLPTLISSIYGMNVEGLPWAKEKGAFWIVIGIAAVVAIIGSVILIVVTNKSVRLGRKKHE